MSVRDEMVQEFKNIWSEGYDEGRRHGIAVMAKVVRQVVAANNGQGLSPEALEVVLDAVQAEVGTPAGTTQQSRRSEP